jgi:hypothetical protein
LPAKISTNLTHYSAQFKAHINILCPSLELVTSALMIGQPLFSILHNPAVMSRAPHGKTTPVEPFVPGTNLGAADHCVRVVHERGVDAHG